MLLLCFTALTGMHWCLNIHMTGFSTHVYHCPLICHSVVAGSQEDWWFLDLSLLPLVWSVGLLKLELNLTLKLMLGDWRKIRGAVIKILCLFQSNRLKIKEDTNSYWKQKILVEFSNASYLFRQLPGEPGISQSMLWWNTGVFSLFLLKLRFSKCHVYFNF